ncbi:hypothetical protein SISNIDRAFT_221363 [Sistotremastrum niveocremeum HHB9708]|uniref:Uncharacterized protein n=1 Tax=Sistotremastrum niveocremeum HHB9708 TaxID=1314777 RepID=A0A164QLW4_9AGAM|nr:hypothetical protein SISNIDRAFT_221363 [Sistotremastrum niveocremeum HHB9708]
MHKLYKRESEWARELQLLLLYGATPTPPPSPEGGLYDLVTAEDPAGSPKTHSSPKINFARGLQLSLLDAMNPEMTEDERKRGMRALASKMMLTRRDRRTRSVVNVSYTSGSSQSAVAGDDASPLADVDSSGGSARRVRSGGGTDSGVIVRKKSSLSTTMSFEAENENDGINIID